MKLLKIREFQRELKIPESMLSQLLHFTSFALDRETTRLEKGMLIISIDIDVGSEKVGVVNQGKNDRNVHKYFSERTVGKIEEQALPLFVNLFEEVEMPATFAIRGQMLEVDSSPFELLINSKVKHDIGSHGFSHRTFPSLSHKEAEMELAQLSQAMKKFNIFPTSFIFPRNSMAHLSLLEKYGYKSIRTYGNFMLDCMQIKK